MIFTQTIQTPEHQVWLSDCGHYRILYKNMFASEPKLPHGYKPGYYALVKKSYADAPDSWDYADRRAPHRSYGEAEKGCKRNKTHWRRFLKAESTEEMKDLIEKSRVGLSRTSKGCVYRTWKTQKILGYPPTWVLAVIRPKRRRLLPGAKLHKRTKARLAEHQPMLAA